MLPITATFLDEISHDIPHQKWGKAEWDLDVLHMKKMGIDTVVLIRCGYKKWLTYPSQVVMKEEGGYHPPVDLVDLFLTLSEKYEMSFYFGLYDSGKYWWEQGNYQKEVDINLKVIDEVWYQCGNRAARNVKAGIPKRGVPAAIGHRHIARRYSNIRWIVQIVS